MGAWIEINIIPLRCTPRSSLLAWERGLKLPMPWQFVPKLVAPCVGAWIEIQNRMVEIFEEIVAPCVGAWIEIFQ